MKDISHDIWAQGLPSGDDGKPCASGDTVSVARSIAKKDRGSDPVPCIFGTVYIIRHNLPMRWVCTAAVEIANANNAFSRRVV